MFGFYYQVNGTRVLVRNRPKSLSIGENTLDEKDVDVADAYLSVTDTFVTPPANKTIVWFPWNEDRMPIPEMYYATNTTLYWWVFKVGLKDIQVFCDGGTHRSVTVFGAFLRTYFSKAEARAIVDARVGVGEKTWADPLEYIDRYIEDFPADKLLFKAMGNYTMARLDSYSKDVHGQVKKRYGEDR